MKLARRTWAFAGGKGGTGKSVLAASVAVHLADLGFEVLLVDGDLSAANLHSLFGIEHPSRTVMDFFAGEGENILAAALPTEQPRLRLLAGPQNPISAAGIRYQQKMKLVRGIEQAEADVVILDLPTGVTPAEVEMFCSSQLPALVITPEPTAVENAYRLLRLACYKLMREVPGFKKLEKNLSPELREKAQSPAEFLERLREKDRELAEALARKLGELRPGFVINQVKEEEERNLGLDMRLVAERFFGIQPWFLGAVEYDECVRYSVRHGRPLLLEYPHSRPSRSVRRVAETMLSLARTRE